ncbi:S1C family serine protease [Natronolimnohabitans innermongolicus]|uniref:Peptidase S1 and S6 chymotrypsin/Hap n=1 Tax=Natronolimnohabitans innermongolicus JCM 12255 TaxID=1227499 RepID=L9XBI8_9EURY|nr:trypsin-like peptidase domain-containing protein [Natronolimnohabitans innermongolicus]ELY59104.1 peptidase S1 and S6 chymotrypsin/Hap [Natronolimnohabitans innermongolicus JCM 12255]
MNGFRTDRRDFLALVGAGVAGSLAGCAEPSADDDSEANSPSPIGQRTLAEGSEYTDVYESVIDAVTQVRAMGIVDSPFGGGEGQGSGFLFDETHVVTNEHVVAGADDVDLQYVTGDWTDTTVVGTDHDSDLAVLEVDRVPDEATPLSLSTDRPVVGQEVLAIGNPYGLEGTMTTGVVSGVDRTLDFRDRNFSFPNVIQTDAAVNPGNSGGPLVDLEGDVVGVINAGGGDNIGFAISAALTSRVVPALIESGEYDHPYLGIGLATVDKPIAEANDLPETTGIVVTDVESGGPADGVLEDATPRTSDGVPTGGDVVFAIDGEPIPDRHALSTYLALRTSPGETIDLECWRDGSETTVSMTLGARPQPSGSGGFGTRGVFEETAERDSSV